MANRILGSSQRRAAKLTYRVVTSSAEMSCHSEAISLPASRPHSQIEAPGQKSLQVWPSCQNWRRGVNILPEGCHLWPANVTPVSPPATALVSAAPNRLCPSLEFHENRRFADGFVDVPRPGLQRCAPTQRQVSCRMKPQCCHAALLRHDES